MTVFFAYFAEKSSHWIEMTLAVKMRHFISCEENVCKCQINSWIEIVDSFKWDTFRSCLGWKQTEDPQKAWNVNTSENSRDVIACFSKWPFVLLSTCPKISHAKYLQVYWYCITMMQNILSHPYLLQKVATFRDISSGSVATFRDISRHFVRFAWALRKFVFSGVAVCPAQVTRADNISVIQLADNSTPKKHSVHKTASFITAF